MTHAKDKNRKDLIARVKNAIEQGGLLTEDVLTYVESALFTPEPEALIDFMADETDCERDTLLDLVFSPDQAFQVNLEPLLESSTFSAEDEIEMEKHLSSARILAPIHLPDEKDLTTIEVPEDIKTRYLTRLNMTNHLEPRIRTSIEKGVRDGRCIVVKVKMRNSGFSPLPHQRVFLCRFFERMEDGAPEYLQCLDLVLSLLGSATGKKDIYALLAEQKRTLFRGLKQMKRFEDLLSRSNMETLMLQGIRAPHSSRQELLSRMELIDRICFGVFGKTEIIPEPLEETIEGIEELISPTSTV